METAIKITKREENGVFIFEFAWELDETNADKTFTQLYKDIGSFEWAKIILDLAGLKYLNSKSIGYIADIFSNIEETEGQMFIANCDEWVKDILELVWITTIVPTVDSIAEAMAQIA